MQKMFLRGCKYLPMNASGRFQANLLNAELLTQGKTFIFDFRLYFRCLEKNKTVSKAAI